MSLAPGTRLGPYEIVTPLGAGGMGEVYRARDTKLTREVAITIMPEAVAADPVRLLRFEREVQSLAALNHPNIAAIYAVEDRAVVMELVAGEDLSTRRKVRRLDEGRQSHRGSESMISSIRGWLTGRKDEPEFPSYSELRLTPTRPLPAELQEQERGADFSTRCDALRSELLQLARRPPDDEPRFFEFLSPTKRGVVTITLPDNGGPCLPVFSTAFRAEDYRRTQLGPDFRVGWLRSSPEALLRMLHDVAGAGVQTFALDRCPRCTTFVAIDGRSITSPDALVTLWATKTSCERARLELYVAHAYELAHGRRLDVARDVALETVGHVTFEDPRPHLLLGQLGVELRDAVLVREARACLRSLKFHRWQQKLDEAVTAGSSDFAIPAS